MLPDWIGAHVNALAAIGGVPKALVSDNLKAGITKPSRYEPGINRTYQDLADHYGCVVLPTRVRKPRDKAKVEVAVLIVERFVLAKLRNRRFFSLDELNAEIRDCVATINAKVMKPLGKSRRELLETIDRPALNELPTSPIVCGMEARPCRARLSHRDRRPLLLGAVAADPRDRRGAHHRRDGRGLPQGPAGREPSRSRVRNRHTTITEHMPSAHRRYAEWTPQRMMREAAKIGPATIALVEAIMKAKPHPEQGFRSCLGIMRLVKTYGPPGRGREPARQRHRRDQLRLDRLDPQERARQSLRQLESAGRPADPARQHPWSWLLPLTQSDAVTEPGG